MTETRLSAKHLIHPQTTDLPSAAHNYGFRAWRAA